MQRRPDNPAPMLGISDGPVLPFETFEGGLAAGSPEVKQQAGNSRDKLVSTRVDGRHCGRPVVACSWASYISASVCVQMTFNHSDHFWCAMVRLKDLRSATAIPYPANWNLAKLPPFFPGASMQNG